VEWDPAALSWADFRGVRAIIIAPLYMENTCWSYCSSSSPRSRRQEVLGPTDPAEAPAGSLRGQIMADWQGLGLSAEPNVGLNGVHASVRFARRGPVLN
jgi:hypothetical protein